MELGAQGLELRRDGLGDEGSAPKWRPLDLIYRDIPETPKIVPRRNVVAVGHRGTMKYAPENTLAAHETAYQMGARGIEFDVRCTKDGHFVVIHDPTVDRTTNGRGWVKNMTLAQIKSLDAGYKKSSKFKGETVPTLREALRNVKGRFIVDIDFKGGPKHSAEMLKDVLDEEWTPSDPLVTIFARRHHFNLLKPLCHHFALRPHYISSKRTERLVNDYPLQIMGLRRISFSPKAATSIRNANLHLFCNVMGADDNHRGFDNAVRAGALFIQTDHLDRLTSYLHSNNMLETQVLGRNFLPITFLE